jgi:two-component system nitrate/nitrite response regulator NarL
MRNAFVAAMLVPVHFRCLIVDDNPSFLTAARDLLIRQGVGVVGLASTGSEALRKASELRPDVVLVDVDLGGESGFDVARLLTETEEVEPVPVVLISTYAEKDFTELIETSPARGFVSKADLSGRAISAVLGGGAPA